MHSPAAHCFKGVNNCKQYNETLSENELSQVPTKFPVLSRSLVNI